MGTLLTVAVILAFLAWLLFPRRRSMPAPEDDVASPIDKEELAAAERELSEDPGARPLDQASEDVEDDWGPGTR